MTSSFLAPTRALVPAVLAAVAWLGAALIAGAAGVFQPEADLPPIAVGVAAVGPPLLVAGLLAGSARFLAWARSLDLRLLTVLQSWRIAGFALIALLAQRSLPAGFALPAGLGDIVVGLTAPAVAVFVIGTRRWAKRIYYGWTFFGIADLVVAVTLGVLHSSGPVGLLADAGPSTELMRVLPMSLIPTFGVPLTLTLHVIALANAARSEQFDTAGIGETSGGIRAKT